MVTALTPQARTLQPGIWASSRPPRPEQRSTVNPPVATCPRSVPNAHPTVPSERGRRVLSAAMSTGTTPPFRLPSDVTVIRQTVAEGLAYVFPHHRLGLPGRLSP